MLKDETGKEYQKGGCGGFGKGNFSELFKSIEEYEKTLEAKRVAETASAWEDPIFASPSAKMLSVT